MQEDLIDGLLEHALSGRRLAPPPRPEWPALLDRAKAHGVVPLMADAFMRQGCAPDFVAFLRPALAAEAALDIVRERELRRALAAFRAAGVDALLFKGAHLAYTIYPASDRRPRVDTDLLVADGNRAAAVEVLSTLGYAAVNQVSGEIAFGQAQFDYADAQGAEHTIDLHWRLANPQVFAHRLPFDDLWRASVPITALGSDARGPSPADAALIACLHRAAHHRASHRLIWLYDLHLLCAAFDDSDWTTLTRMAIDRGLAAVVLAGLDAAKDALATPSPAAVARALREGVVDDGDVRRFLAGASTLGVIASDWRRLPGWRRRAAFLREHLFPPAAYMARKYGRSSRLLLPFLYAHRVVAGAWRIGRRETFSSTFRP